MPLPFILGAAAIAAVGTGAKKACDGYQDSSKADDITDGAKRFYKEQKDYFDKQDSATNASLDKLGKLQLSIGRDFAEFQHISKPLLEKLAQHEETKNLQINIPKNELDKIEGVAFSATAYLGMVAGSAMVGVGATILGGVVVAPIALVAGMAFAKHAEKKLNNSKEYQEHVQKAVDNMSLGRHHLKETENYANKIHKELDRVYQIFGRYFQDLKNMDTLVRNGIDIQTIAPALIQIIQNGYAVAAILTDIITTPLFKAKKDANGELIKDKTDTIEFETDSDGMKIINKEEIDAHITLSTYNSKSFEA